jgi:hypothetical protein
MLTSNCPEENTHLVAGNIDDLDRMVTALLTELWITRDRLAVLEHLIEARGGPGSTDVDTFVPTPEFTARAAGIRDRMVANVAGAPLAARERSVDQILARAGMQRPHPADRGE